eukprot:scaffold27497_cov131-Isochrysis_galbana.AAC.2
MRRASPASLHTPGPPAFPRFKRSPFARLICRSRSWPARACGPFWGKPRRGCRSKRGRLLQAASIDDDRRQAPSAAAHSQATGTNHRQQIESTHRLQSRAKA